MTLPVVRSDSEAIPEAATILERGGLVAFPTETVYGLGADAGNPAAIRRMYRVKGRPADHPCIVHLGDPSWLDRYGEDVPPLAFRLAETFWPGPLTLVVRKKDDIAPEATAGMPTVGLRVPDHPLALELLGTFGKPLVAPSANRFGKISPTTAEHVAADLDDDVDLILDGGPCMVGVESTIVDCTVDPVRILRPGGLTGEDLEAVTGYPVPLVEPDAGVRASGTLPAHYAPRARVVLAAAGDVQQHAREYLDAGEMVAVFAPPDVEVPDGAVLVPAPADLGEYAHEMYAVLRALDAQNADVIVVVPVSEEGLGAAINDRLRRAAAGSGRTDS